MSEQDTPDATFTTVAMAEILMVQDLVKEASEVIARLEQTHPDDERVKALRRRMSQKMGMGLKSQCPAVEKGFDRIHLHFSDDTLHIEWELTDDGLALAKRTVRYSGFSIVRLFSAVPGPRGVRTSVRDLILELNTGQQDISGTAKGAVHTAAVGFLGRNGAFVPMARALPITGG
ncbi:MAG: hypothetical protein JXX14_05825 [Deltaproteobacteria bacterium]|nr:hypothetical protein [Deltaproteobacteria bacterium]